MVKLKVLSAKPHEAVDVAGDEAPQHQPWWAHCHSALANLAHHRQDRRTTNTCPQAPPGDSRGERGVHGAACTFHR